MNAVYVDIYRRMTLIKQNDDRFLTVIKAGRIISPYYSARGQEAIPAAVSVNLTNDESAFQSGPGLPMPQ